MNKQRKVLITITYNEMGIIIDTKAEEVAQPELGCDECVFKPFKQFQPERKWTPCGEKLPEKNGRYLTTNKAWGSYKVDWNAWIDGEWLYPNSEPIAWMPMPEPYKEADEDA